MIKNGVVTVFGVDTESGEYVRRGSAEAWIRHQNRLRDQSNGAKFCDTFDVRIELGKFAQISPGDLISFENLSQPDMIKCRRVAAIRKNDYGNSPHWHIEAEYMYR